MKRVYLATGQPCYLKEKIDQRYIINKIFVHGQFYGDDSETVELIDENDFIVDAIFKTPPILKFSNEIADLIKQKGELQNDIKLLISEKLKLSNEIRELTTTKITKK